MSIKGVHYFFIFPRLICETPDILYYFECFYLLIIKENKYCDE